MRLFNHVFLNLFLKTIFYVLISNHLKKINFKKYSQRDLYLIRRELLIDILKGLVYNQILKNKIKMFFFPFLKSAST